jgi:endonuclease III
MNQSVVDRMDLVIDYDEISVEVMVARAMKRTGETDEDMVREMATIVKNVKETLKNQGDTSGEAGMRSLISWIVSTKVTKNPYKSATLTLFPKATTDAKYREALKSTFLDTSNFYVA